MKKIVLCLLLLCGMFGAVFAQDGTAAGNQRNFFISLGFIDRIMSENFPGGAFSFGYYTSEKSLFTAEINFGFYDAGQIGSYSYENKYWPYNRYDDGKITYNYTAIEFLASWYYVGKISEKFQYRVGPSAGVLAITGSDSYEPTYNIENIPDPTTETKATVTAGAGAGFIWNFNKRWFLDFGYRIMVNPGIKFDERTLDILGTNIKIKEKDFATLSNQFNLTAGFRF